MKPSKKQSSAGVFLLIAFLLGLALLFFTRDRGTKSPTQQAGAGKSLLGGQKIAPGQQEELPGVRDAVPGAFPGSSGGGGGGKGTEDERELFFCRHFDSGIYMVPLQYRDALVKRGAVRVLFTEEESRCLRKGAALRLVFVEVDPVARAPYIARSSLPVGLGSDISHENWQAFTAKPGFDPKGFGFESVKQMLQALSDSYGLDFVTKPLTEFTLVNVEKEKEKPQPFVPEIHPLAKTVSKEEVDKLVKSGVAALEIDPSAAEGGENFAGSLRFQYKGVDAATRFFSYGNMTRMQVDVNKLRSLVGDQPSLIVYGQSIRSLVGYNFVTLMHKMGYKELFFFREGAYGINGEGLETPASYPGVSVIDTLTLKSMLNGKALAVDVRPVANYALGSITGASHAFYYERKNSDGIPVLRGKDINLERIKASGDKYKIPGLDPKPAWVFFGHGPQDWAPLKAAIVARAQKSNVYWYRDGIEAWRFEASRQPEEFPIAANKGVDIYKLGREEAAMMLPGGKDSYGTPLSQPRKEIQRRRVEPVNSNIHEYKLKNLVPPSQ